VFESALRRLEHHQASRNHTRAQINLYRGQLLQSVGNLADARRALEDAIALDPANLYMKRAYLRVRYVFLRQPKLDTAEVPDVAAPALAMAKALLEHDAADDFAREVQRFLYDRWKLQ
jgi:lipoprotein NlpI